MLRDLEAARIIYDQLGSARVSDDEVGPARVMQLITNYAM